MNLIQNFIQHSSLKVNSIRRQNYLGSSMRISRLIYQLLIRYSAFIRYWKKKWKYNETVHQVFIDFMYNILIEFGLPVAMKLVMPIKMCLN
jgi:hypothetical protein